VRRCTVTNIKIKAIMAIEGEIIPETSEDPNPSEQMHNTKRIQIIQIIEGS
jgi:hypothetical protein